ncbi:hypothetical protein RJ640_000676 [Escallonia rubra]|uniref:Rhamnogalacturonan lyase domain-containing protein n=1 Tax=Escallonia rubra TaxID=112253 RepID=A0AA88R5R1_9ASTE|nr:hypothetical protein RJ640_000676 [Escallonia rubra]
MGCGIDIIYTVGLSNYRKDWFFAHVNRHVGNRTYIPTTWRILFDLKHVDQTGNYTLQLALASATTAELQDRINDPNAACPYFTTGLTCKDNAIARHGIHGLYWLHSVYISGFHLQSGNNTIFLTQLRGGRPLKGSCMTTYYFGIDIRMICKIVEYKAHGNGHRLVAGKKRT